MTTAVPEPAGPDPDVSAVRSRLSDESRAGSTSRTALLLVVSMVLFAVSMSSDVVESAGTILVVLLFHELGHYFGMRAFGYRNVKMFFIPFFGAAVSGRNETAPAWQEAVVLLLGPLPGIALGLGIAAAGAEPGTWVYTLAVMLVVVNAANLLPLVPLDGGRLFEVLLLNRLPTLGVLFRLAAVAGLVLIAWWGLPIMWAVAGLILFTTPVTYRQAVAAGAFRELHPHAPTAVADLTDPQLEALIAAARGLFRAVQLTPDQLTTWVRMIHGQAVAPRAGAPAVVALLGLYALGWVGALVFVFALFRPPAPVDEPFEDDDTAGGVPAVVVPQPGVGPDDR